MKDNWLGLNKAKPIDFLLEVDTTFDKKELIKLGQKICTLPTKHNFYKKKLDCFL